MQALWENMRDSWWGDLLDHSLCRLRFLFGGSNNAESESQESLRGSSVPKGSRIVKDSENSVGDGPIDTSLV